MRAERTKPWRSCLRGRSAAVWLAVGLLLGGWPALGQLLPASPGQKVPPPLPPLPVSLFEFELVEGPETGDGYFGRIRSLVMYSLEDELERQVQHVTRHALAPRYRELAPAELKQETGADFAIFGRLEVDRGNIWITAELINLDSGRRQTLERPLGRTTLDNFDDIESEGRQLADSLVDAMFASLGEPGPQAEAVLVSCIQGGASVDMGFLDRFLTFELPPVLAEALAIEGVPPQRLQVVGLTFDEYEGCSLPLGSQRIPVRAVAPTLSGLRFVLRGSVLPSEEGFLVQVRMQDVERLRRSSPSLTIGEFPGGKRFKELPAAMAKQLAERLVLYLAQEKLAERGFDPGRLDGVMGEETASALSRFQAENRLGPSGQIDPATLAALGLGGGG